MTKGQIRQKLIDSMIKDGPRVDALAGQIWTMSLKKSEMRVAGLSIGASVGQF